MPKQFQGPEMEAKRVAASHTPEAIAKRKATFDEKARERDRRDHAGFQKRMPNGELWHVWVKQHQDELLDMAANIAVDMERGLIIDPRTEKPWVGGYVKRRIFEFLEVEGLKLRNVTEGGSLPEFMAEPMFSRAVEWARVKRDHSYRVSMQENLPIIKAIYGGATMEIARRIYLDPAKIPDNVLWPEWRKLGVMLAELGGAKIPENINIIINNFRDEVQRMPEEARDAALNIFRSEVRALVAGSKEAESIIDAQIAEVASS